MTKCVYFYDVDGTFSQVNTDFSKMAKDISFGAKAISLLLDEDQKTVLNADVTRGLAKAQKLFDNSEGTCSITIDLLLSECHIYKVVLN